MSLPWGEMPYDTKIPAEVVYDYAVTRGDLLDSYARRQLADWIERYAAEQVRQERAAWVAKIEALADDFHNRGTEADRRHEPNAYARRAAWDRASELVRALLPSDATEALDTEAGR